MFIKERILSQNGVFSIIARAVRKIPAFYLGPFFIFKINLTVLKVESFKIKKYKCMHDGSKLILIILLQWSYAVNCVTIIVCMGNWLLLLFKLREISLKFRETQPIINQPMS